MAKIVYPSWLPRLVTPAVIDAANDLRALRGDYKGGAFAGARGTYAAVYRENLTAGGVLNNDVILTTTAVPAGYLYIIESVAVHHTDPTARDTHIEILSGGVFYQLSKRQLLALGDLLPIPNNVVLAAGEQIRGRAYNVLQTAFLFLSIVGYKVQL